MAIGNNIIATSHPSGKFEEGFLGESLKPGVCVQVDWSVAENGGRYTYTHFGGGSRLVLVLLPENLNGQLRTTTISSGNKCTLYTPRAGDELNMLVANSAGSGESLDIGDSLSIDPDTGKLVIAPTEAEASFIVLETIESLDQDTLVWSKFTKGSLVTTTPEP